MAGMTSEAFRTSLAAPTRPAELSAPLAALWHAGRGEWDEAHAIVQEDETDPLNAWVHAHLHRQEGDLGNAAYWYRRAGRPVSTLSIEAEWREIAAGLLQA